MMNSLKLKGIQLSCCLTGLATLIVSFWAGSLKSQIIIKNGKRSPMIRACPTLEDPYPPFTGAAWKPPESGKADLQFRRQQSFTVSAKKVEAVGQTWMPIFLAVRLLGSGSGYWRTADYRKSTGGPVSRRS
jgi:hypothetical protein